MTKKDIQLDQDWLNVITGDVVINMDKKWQLQARLVRTALLKQKFQIENRIPDQDLHFQKKLRTVLEQEGLLKSESKIQSWGEHKSKALVFLLVAAGVVWATKIEPHFTKAQITVHSDTEEKVTKTQQQDFWANNFNNGSFTGFWSRLNNYVDLAPKETTITYDTACHPEHLTIEGCSKLALEFNSAAQFNMGLMYEQGINVSRDYNRSLEWYKKSAALGNTQAKFNMNYLIIKKLVQ